MQFDAEEFVRRVVVLLERFLAQNFQVAALRDCERLATQLASLIAERGLPPPLPPGEPGSAGGMAEAECSKLVAQVLDGTDAGSLVEPARQLVKTCFYPQFAVCRDSYCETAPDGLCRRQELPRARRRISGAHCVDCPHWERLSPAAHAEFLATQWKQGRGEFEAAQGIFLPEDFRALRRCVREQARKATP